MNVTGVKPKTLDRWTRARDPPRLARTTIRTVWPPTAVVTRVVAADQEPTRWSSPGGGAGVAVDGNGVGVGEGDGDSGDDGGGDDGGDDGVGVGVGVSSRPCASAGAKGPAATTLAIMDAASATDTADNR
ncbi:hypothetical protein GCM10023193_16650 [Planotetraspora kaengkrachanensis]|uniref:Uncharacterized protein n=1 Tax=Planotetraspora kaengkrachanensis TaxID=575193 RepID=A0A8J3M0K8_9ACTN|nr:hypothetical protein Pka01_29850 [Planotetraspora kaengkrachanensis]